MNRTFTISIDCDNAAFDGNPSMEIARQLRLLANQLHDTDVLYGREDRGGIRDTNGNAVGTWRFTVEGTNS